MKKISNLMRACCMAVMLTAASHPAMADSGVPFFHNYTAKDYNGHNRNYDVVCDNAGTVFVANFEGLLYFDGATWRKVYTPGISRVTRLARAKSGRIWVGGHNIFGYLTTDENHCICLRTIVSDDSKNNISEVDNIYIKGNDVYFHTSTNQSFRVTQDLKLKRLPADFQFPIDDKSQLSLPFDIHASFIPDNKETGISFSGKDFTWSPITEDDGLTSNLINSLTFDGAHSIWGATDKGIFNIDVVAPYGQITDRQGLKGEVMCISELGNSLYFGTLQGLYKKDETSISRIGNISVACWQLVNIDSENILAATSNGLYSISTNGIKRVTSGNTLSVQPTLSRNIYITGEIDGMYIVSQNGTHRKINNIEKVTSITVDGYIFKAETIYGELWQINYIPNKGYTSKLIRKQPDPKSPKLSYIDQYHTKWETDPTGHKLTARSKNEYGTRLKPWIFPFGEKSVNCVYVSKNNDIWVGGDFGVYFLDSNMAGMMKMTAPVSPIIREITSMGDSILYGGFTGDSLKVINKVPLLQLNSSCNQLTVTFSTPLNTCIFPTKYRYRIDEGRWSSWSTDNSIELPNLSYGSSSIDIQALDLFGRISPSSSVIWRVEYPYYMRWWAISIYIIIITWFIHLFLRWRTEKLKRDKQKLEEIVNERTSELAESNEQLSSVNSQLSTTLDDLKKAQENLVRMERTATAGKLTQGLIDRILNPINYINNFSKLTSGLAKDLQEDIEDEKENISEDNYEDCEDILDMMKQNLQKIEEHGVNTTRTLRAMEAMLNNHIGILVEQDLTKICTQAVKVTSEYHKKEVSECGIIFVSKLPLDPLMHSVDAEAINKVLLSMLTNSVYAVTKKYRQAKFEPEIFIELKKDDNGCTIILRDNGIGMEETIIDKVFDPFFTTKTTGEAAGVGLYLVREIINDHHGTISVSSKKDEFCEFVIHLKNKQS